MPRCSARITLGRGRSVDSGRLWLAQGVLNTRPRRAGDVFLGSALRSGDTVLCSALLCSATQCGLRQAGRVFEILGQRVPRPRAPRWRLARSSAAAVSARETPETPHPDPCSVSCLQGLPLTPELVLMRQLLSLFPAAWVCGRNTVAARTPYSSRRRLISYRRSL